MACEPDLALLLTGPHNGPYHFVTVNGAADITTKVPLVIVVVTSIDAPGPLFAVRLAPDRLTTDGSPVLLCPMMAQMFDEPKRKYVCHSTPLKRMAAPDVNSAVRI